MDKRLLISLFLIFTTWLQASDYVPRDYVWTTQSKNSCGSMPCGGHDIGMNVWVEKGDILFYIAQSGWFDENNTLLKAGRWRIHLQGKPLDSKDFQQRLCLDEGAIYIKGGGVCVRIWADVEEPVVFVAIESPKKRHATLSYESWRYKDRPLTKAECQQCSYKWVLPKDTYTLADSITPILTTPTLGEAGRRAVLSFSHHNRPTTVFDYAVSREHMDDVKGSLFNPIGSLSLRGEMSAPGFHYVGTTDGIYASTDYRSWNFRHDNLTESTIAIRLSASSSPTENKGTECISANTSQSRSARWWHGYWQRSWIQTDTPPSSAEELTTMVRNYELFRYMLGCNAYGQWPTKFNGGLFTFDPVYVDPATPFTPDYRKWGGGTMTAQNQRLVYWPMLKSGDTDMMTAQLDTYLRLLPTAEAWSRNHWGHEGACFSEQLENFGLPNPAEYGTHPEGSDYGMERNAWLEYEWDTALEFCMMAFQVRQYTGEDISRYEPMIRSCLRFFDEHYQYLARQRGSKALDGNGKLIIYPGSGCETYKMAYNPSSTIAALRALATAIGDTLLLSRLPETPLTNTAQGDTLIAPAVTWARIQNVETPQLYPVFPWRLYGLGRPHLDIARNTYLKDPHAIAMRSSKGWKQDNIWAACLGLTDEACRLNAEKLGNGPYRFPAFWDAGFDWAPDHNRGGAGMIALQEMLLQEDPNHDPILFPAWPRKWNCRFRLNISGQRCVDAEIKDGIVTSQISSQGSCSSTCYSQFGNAQWIGAITKQASRLPEGRNYTGAKLKEPAVKDAWQNADTLSQRSIILHRDIRLKGAVRKATAYITGLGFYEFAVNGKKIGDAVFAPLWSDYDKTIYYNTYDVTSQLTHQANPSPSLVEADSVCFTHNSSLSVLLGNGFYNEQGKRYSKMRISFGPPTLLFRLHIEYANGETEDVVSDNQWQWELSPITFNSIYGGEDYDARLEQPTDWRPVVIQEAPKGVLRPQTAYPVNIMERFSIKDTIRNDSVLVLDMGQNLAGFPEITVQGRSGQKIKITPGETLTEEGLVSQKQTGRPHYYTYTLKGEANSQFSVLNSQPGYETWHPRFSYYGYRYLQVEGDLEVLKNVESCFVYNSAPKTGDFECSNPLFNDAYRLIDRAIRSNWQSVWTDCPHREKLGWLEQTWLNGEGLVANYDCQAMIEQTMQNIADAQYPNGALPEIAPNYVIFEGSWAPPFLESPEWGGAFIALPFLYKTFYGDDKLITRYRPQMKRYVDYLATQDSCYILRQGLGDWYDYGPGRAGFAQNTPMPLVSTAHYYWWNHLLGEPRADSIRAAFIKEFYDASTHKYATGSQCAQAIALEMNLIPEGHREDVLQQLINDIHAHGDRLTTGDVGNRYLFNALVNNGQQELLYKMLNHYDVPGYGYQISLGHTTLTEQWNPMFGASQNHFMMGHINNLLVPYFLGICRNGDNITIAPHPVGNLTWCRGQMDDIKASWSMEGNTFVIIVDIPAGRKATVNMPYSGQKIEVKEGKHTLKEKTNKK